MTFPHVYSKTLNLMPHKNVKTQSDTYCKTFFERPRSHVELYNKKNDILILELWDAEVVQAIQDGYLNIKKYMKVCMTMLKGFASFEPKTYDKTRRIE